MRKTSACEWSRVSAALPAVCCLGALSLSGCLDRDLAPLSPCLVSTVSDQISATNVDSVDVLFMIDNSISMADEQVALARELPQLVRVLSSGDRNQDGIQDFRPVELRLGVITSDMGLPGVQGGACMSGLGDNARLQSRPNVAGLPSLSCASAYPSFISFSPPTGGNAQADVERVANDFACISALGTSGCGFEQQLEATLKALWPSDHMVQGLDARAALGQFPGFAIDPLTQQGANGQGDPLGQNAGFLHNDEREGLSLIAVVLVTDEEDCSSWTFDHLAWNGGIDDNDPQRVHPNLRCFRNKQNLYPVQRYIDGLKALRPGDDNLVVFAAITGVLPALVDGPALAGINFDNRAQSDAFYDGILSHSSMIETVNAEGSNLNTSCTAGANNEQKAFPPRRIVEVAKGFGANGIIQSICQASFAPAMDRIIDRIVANLPEVCLPRKLTRTITGEVDCRVVWDLPIASAIAPTRCDDARYQGLLSPPRAGRLAMTEDGRAICEVTQVPVRACTPTGSPTDVCGNGIGPVSGGRGWYYDDFSRDLEACPGVDKQRITFTADAAPPTGVRVRLECTREVQGLTTLRDDLLNPATAPSLGQACLQNFDCAAPLNETQSCLSAQPYRMDVSGVCHDTSMFCHGTKQVCVRACANDSECPDAWTCDVNGVLNPLTETGNQPICVNPTCGD